MDSEKKHLRLWSLGITTALLLIVVRGHARHGSWNYFLLSIILTLLVITLLRVDLLAPLFRGWMKIIYFLGNWLLLLVLTSIFYLLFGTLGFLLKLFHKDPLDKILDPTARSYWHYKKITSFNKNQYTKQF